MDTLIRRVRRSGLLELVLASPHNRNALSRQLVAELFEGLASAERDPEVAVVLIRQEGPVFCSGADLSEMTDSNVRDAPKAMVLLQHRMATLSKPVVVRVEGAVRAGGIGIVAAADVAVAATDASFALTEVRLGLAPAVVSAPLLARMHPRAVSRYFLTAETFDGATAEKVGLATLAVARAELDTAVEEVCTALLEAKPQGLRETKKLTNASLVAELTNRGDDLAELSASLFGSDVAQAAMSRFLARTK
ncbi:enoyl-CoA hydratase [Rhodococcus sp. 14C212]|uniref:enoyl-CoA hydratase-related protein n=1 Tax=Rhodococcus sp. 14C212 TaxID=2711209 RepID=UPI0013EBF7FD|nr:enoyl-CoA hydratase-related protein [Rhodococcus sp. 14C212]NGP08485.1 enoyl-CoA hydratase [Rhodococcus sp. 14C212]